MVVCNFIGGLVPAHLPEAAYRVLARATDIPDRLRLYGLIELLVAAAAALTVLVGLLPADLFGTFPYHLHDGIWVQDLGYRFGQLAAAVVCVFTPCFLMGTTFPLLSQALLDAPGGQRLPAALYAWNTFGACSGVLACQFLLLPSIGHSYTFWLMLALNLAIAGVFLIAGRGDLPVASLMGGAASQNANRMPARTFTSLSLLLTCALLSGLLTGAAGRGYVQAHQSSGQQQPGCAGPGHLDIPGESWPSSCRARWYGGPGACE